MNDRKLCGIGVCITYVLLAAVSVSSVLSGLVTHPGVGRFLLNWPIRLQIAVADAIGLGPVLTWLYRTIHWSAPYAVLLAATLYVLYWVGWWIERIDEETRASALQPPAVALDDAGQAGRGGSTPSSGSHGPESFAPQELRQAGERLHPGAIGEDASGPRRHRAEIDDGQHHLVERQRAVEHNAAAGRCAIRSRGNQGPHERVVADHLSGSVHADSHEQLARPRYAASPPPCSELAHGVLATCAAGEDARRSRGGRRPA